MVGKDEENRLLKTCGIGREGVEYRYDTTGVDYGYLGKSYDSRTGLYNYGYRDYNPQTVRFTEDM